MISKVRRGACLCLTAVFAASMIAGNVLALADNGDSLASELYDTVNFENVTGKMDLSSVALQNLNSSVLENTSVSASARGRHTLIVSLKDTAVLDSKSTDETVAEYVSSYSGQRTLANVKSSQEKFLANLTSAGVNYKYKTSFNTILNAVVIEADSSAIETIKGIPSVTSVVFSETYAYPEAVTTASSDVTSNPSNVYATGIYDSGDIISGYGVDGSGMTVAILDTGLDYTHDAFSTMPENYSMSKQDVEKAVKAVRTNDDGTVSAALNAVSLSAAKGDTVTADELYINNKVPFAYDYADKDTDVYPSYSQHGVHVAGIVAGEADSYTDKDGNVATDADGNPISFRGVAPKAQLVICKVFTDDLDSPDIGGAVTEDIIAALEDCVTLGVDIINMSLGTSSGFSSISVDGDSEGELLNRTYASIKEEGINLICAASNDYSSGYGSVFGTNLASNPDSGTVGSPSTFTGAVSVASINGQLSRYFLVEGSGGATTPVYYEESSDANSVQYDFLARLTERYPQANGRFKYVVIPGLGNSGDYSTSIKNILGGSEPVIAVIKRGTSTFLDKVDIAMRMGAEGVIIYNNVAGTVRMNLGELEDPVPAVSVSMDAGAILTSVGSGGTGYIQVDDSYQAGPFMNDYSSWGATPDLKLKPDVTAHGGEITSTVSGGYSEMSGTSMASPNLAGFTALLRSYLKTNEAYSAVLDGYIEGGASEAQALTRLTNQIVMSSAETVYDQNGLPYSPRKQGAGLATLSNAFSTRAILSTDSLENDYRPKFELGDDEKKNGVYDITFKVTNFGSGDLTFKARSIFMTETIAGDGLAVAEKAYLLDDIAAVWTINGKTYAEGDSFSVPSGASYEVTVRLTLSDAEKAYIDKNFVNGMYVEGFIKLDSESDGQCALNLPFMGFYGDWEAAPLLDYDCYEISEFLQDTSFDDETRPQASVWATQAYASYYNDKYVVPLGNYVYIQDESVDQMYTDIEHAAISCYNEYYGVDATNNYMTTNALKAVYAGLLRNAEVVTYELYNAETGEYVSDGEIYRVGKAYASGGSTVPAQVLLELTPEELGLVNNGKYAMDFRFYFKAEDKDNPDKQSEDNIFSMVFYVDYEAPVLVESRIRYTDYKDGNKDRQRVYLDLDIYDNHYAQAVLLCYAEDAVNADEGVKLNLATEYITPVYNAVKNGITTVSIEITDYIEEYQNRLYIEIDDYALNHSVWSISFSNSNEKLAPSSFEIVEDGRVTTNSRGVKELTLSLNESYKLSLDYEGDGNLSNFTWSSALPAVVKVKNGELFGAGVGTSLITVTGADGSLQRISVTVTDSTVVNLPVPAISFGLMRNADDSLVKAVGTVKVNAGADFTLGIDVDPWYYPSDTLKYRWTSSDESLATVDEYGNVSVKDEKDGKVSITAVVVSESGTATLTAATVQLDVQDAFTVSNYTLTKYHGRGGVVYIPDDENIMTIGEEAFKDNDNVTAIIIPKTVTTISERAFINCSALEYVYFIDTEQRIPADADLSLISADAFSGCTKLKVLDLSNCKTITVARAAFAGCTSLERVVKMSNIGTAHDYAFMGCTSLESADISGLHVAGDSVFAGCVSIAEVTTAYYSAIGKNMFSGCTALEEVTVYAPSVGESAFRSCTALKKVTFADDELGRTLVFTIGDRAFYRCSNLTEVNFNGLNVRRIGEQAFADCEKLATMTLPAGDTTYGDQAFAGTGVAFTASGSCIVENGAVYSSDGKTLLIAPKTISSSFALKDGITGIGAYAFSSSAFEDGAKSFVIPETVTSIGEGAFAHTNLNSVTFNSAVKEIPDYAFYGSSLEAVTIPAAVTSIGASAFEGNTGLASVTFEEGSELKSIGDEAFKYCQSLTSITLPDGASVMGSRVFYSCDSLTEATLPSVTSLGSETFWLCLKLTKVAFGENATTTGDYTFFTGYDAVVSGGKYEIRYYINSLEEVKTGGKTNTIGEGAFMMCTSLTSVNLSNITEVGNSAFYGCSALGTVTGLEKIVAFGDGAFYGCSALGGTLNLSSAEEIGDSAFYSLGTITSINIPQAKTIGSFAFYGCRETSINIPATVTYVGEGAFAYSLALNTINVSADNVKYFSENGVLYRRITDYTTGKEFYELCAYPSSKLEPTYTIKEGTVSVQDYAFAGLVSGAVDTVVFTYAVRVIGSSAFYASGIKTYDFRCVTAPSLIAEIYETGVDNVTAMYYLNFEDAVIAHTGVYGSSYTPSTLSMVYPSNGEGYNNFIYATYFPNAVKGDAVMDETTRALRELLDSIVEEADADAVSGWVNLEVNDANTSKVKAYSENVKEAHRLYNEITDEVQLGFLGTDYSDTLFAIEAALKPVKTRFNIAVTPSTLTVSPDSTHRTNYVKGETFDMSGLILIVTYDDYSTEIADMSLIKIADGYDGPLDTYDNQVVLSGYGKTVRISITVTDTNHGGGDEDDGDKLNPAVIYGPIIGVVVLAAAAVAAVILVKRYKIKKSGSGSETETTEDVESADNGEE